MMCSYSLYLLLMYFNPAIEKFLYRITNTAREHHLPEHHLGYSGLAPARDDGTDEFCSELHHKHEDQEGEEEEETTPGGLDMNGAAMLMINDEDVEIKTDVGSPKGTPDKGNVWRNIIQSKHILGNVGKRLKMP